VKKLKFKLFLAWYDFWVGLFYDRKRKILYVNPLPMVVLSFASDRNEWNGTRWEVRSSASSPIYTISTNEEKANKDETPLSDA
jgi:hypothetical protein